MEESNNLLYIDDNIYDLPQEERLVGGYLYDKHNQELGRLQGLLVDADNLTVRYAVFTEGGFLFTDGKTILLPRPLYHAIDMGKIKIDWSRESLQQAPTIHSLEDISKSEERAILSYFDQEPYWEDHTLDPEEPSAGDAPSA